MMPFTRHIERYEKRLLLQFVIFPFYQCTVGTPTQLILNKESYFIHKYHAKLNHSRQFKTPLKNKMSFLLLRNDSIKTEWYFSVSPNFDLLTYLVLSLYFAVNTHGQGKSYLRFHEAHAKLLYILHYFPPFHYKSPV